MRNFIILFLLLLLFSCGKDIDTFRPLANIEQLNSLFEELQDPAEVKHYANNASAITLNFDNVSVRVLPNSFVFEDGTPCFDSVSIALKTMTSSRQLFYEQLNTEINNELFHVNEAYHLAFTSDGQEVYLSDDTNVKLYIPQLKENTLSTTLYYTPNKREINWSDLTSTKAMISGDYVVQDIEGVNWTGFGYEITITNSGWYAVIDDSRPIQSKDEVSFCINKESEFDFTNALVYLIPQTGKGCKVIPYNTFVDQFCDTWVVNREEEDYRVLLLSIEDDETYHIYSTQINLSEDVTIEASGEYVDRETILGLLSAL